MGSNFEFLEPDLGIIIEERGKTKKGNQNFSILYGKYSKQDYTEKFSKTSFNFGSGAYTSAFDAEQS
jgi:hypothetical protein